MLGSRLTRLARAGALIAALLLGASACNPAEPTGLGADASVVQSAGAVVTDSGVAGETGAVETPNRNAASQGNDASSARPAAPPPAALDAGMAQGNKTGAEAGAPACRTFDSSFAAIQQLIFEGRGCTASACHGQAKVGGLDLRAEVAWENLVDAKSANSPLARVQPGTANDSFIYQKLLAATKPGSVKVMGSPMPVGIAPLSERELEAVQLWIVKGAPKTGAVSDPLKGLDVGSLLDACLPPATPVKAKPLDPPAPEEGIQFRLPPYLLKAGSEIEQCTPFAYDFSEQVPAQYKDSQRNVIFVNGTRVRQDPQSHHMVVWNPKKDLAAAAAEAGPWSCRGGERADQSCAPNQGSRDCGSGVCVGPVTKGSLCGIETSSLASGVDSLEALVEALTAGLGILASGGLPDQIANTQAPQEYVPPMEGVYSEIPLSGILWFNSHAFNLTSEDTTLEARVNFYYATKLEREMRPVNVIDDNYIAAGQAPFTRKTYCAKHVVPQNYSLAMMTGHTHRRGEHFWVTDAAGQKIYENFNYNDPEYKRFDPWLDFTAADEASRTLEYCATYNNGLKKDDTPDLELVTRQSRLPDRTSCTPVACVAGKLAAACTSDRDCDSAPGKGDGDCDACPIVGGPTTENEMFVLMPWYVLPPKN